MSNQHSRLVQVYNNTEASHDRIWKVAETVWSSCSSAVVCRAFILAYRLMQRIINEDGHNGWLATGTSHCHVRRDFIDTNTGVRPRAEKGGRQFTRT
jgi:hypothetical protein